MFVDEREFNRVLKSCDNYSDFGFFFGIVDWFRFFCDIILFMIYIFFRKIKF